MFARLLFLLLLCTNTSAYALDCCRFDSPLTIADLVSIALENNPRTRLAWIQARKKAASVGLAASNYYPQIGLEGYASHGRQFKFLNGPDVNYTNVGADLTLRMMLCDFGRTDAGVEEAKYALLAANWQADWVMQKVMIGVLENAYALIHAQESLKAYEETLRDAQGVLYTSNELQKSGLRAISDVYTGRATLSLARMETAQHRSLVKIQMGKLAASLGLPVDTFLFLSPIEVTVDSQSEEISLLIANAQEQRADLMAQRARLVAAKQNARKSNADYYPRISMCGRGGADHYFQDKTDPIHYDITLNLEIPLFNGFATTYNSLYAYAEVESAGQEMEQMQLDIALEVLTYARTLEASVETFGYAKENLEASLMAYQGVMDKYKAGKEGIAEVSNALRQLAGARIRYSDVQTRYLISVANLAYATGTLRKCP